MDLQQTLVHSYIPTFDLSTPESSKYSLDLADKLLLQIQKELTSALSADNKAIPYSPATPTSVPTVNSRPQGIFKTTVWRKALSQSTQKSTYKKKLLRFNKTTKLQRQRRTPKQIGCFRHFLTGDVAHLYKNSFLHPPKSKAPLHPNQQLAFQIVQHRIKRLSTLCLQREVLLGLEGDLKGWQQGLTSKGFTIGGSTSFTLKKDLLTHWLKNNWERRLWFWKTVDRAINLSKNREIFLTAEYKRNKWDISFSLYETEKPKYVGSFF